jgi:hypothetical protein
LLESDRITEIESNFFTPTERSPGTRALNRAGSK